MPFGSTPAPNLILESGAPCPFSRTRGLCGWKVHHTVQSASTATTPFPLSPNSFLGHLLYVF